MQYRSGSGSGGILGFPPAISQLVLINIVVFLIQQLVPGHLIGLGLSSYDLFHGRVWELVTYMFLHGGISHIFWNMFMLVMFGTELERWWGSRDFTKYYLVCGIGGGLVQAVVPPLLGSSPYAPTIGASGAIFGLLIAYGMAFPNRTVLLWFIIPMSARVMVALAVVIQLMLISAPDHVARFCHLGGGLIGYLYLKSDILGWKARRWMRRLRATAGASSSRGRRPSTPDPELQERIDAILEKISREGMGSLTEEEKKVLHESASRARRRQGQDT